LTTSVEAVTFTTASWSANFKSEVECDDLIHLQ